MAIYSCFLISRLILFSTLVLLLAIHLKSTAYAELMPDLLALSGEFQLEAFADNRNAQLLELVKQDPSKWRQLRWVSLGLPKLLAVCTTNNFMTM